MSTTDDTIALIKGAQTSPDDLIKSFVQPSTATTGLQAYNLEGPSKKLFPALTPLRNRIARVSGGFAIQANWKAITNINVGNVRAGVSEGRRGGVIAHSQSEYFAAFRAFGLENNVTFEAGYAAKGYEDVKALAVQATLQATMIQEEKLILGGNTSFPLGSTPTPTVTPSNSGGSLTASVSPVRGAVGYAWYVGTAGSEKLVSVTSIPSVLITTAPAGGAQTAASLAASDNSVSSLDFDGLLTMAFNPALNAYYYQMPAGTAGVGTGLTADGAGGIAEFEVAFASFYNKYRLSPTVMFVSAQELANITKKIVANSGAPLLRLNTDAANPGVIQASVKLGSYLNKVTGDEVAVVVHPNMPAGTIFFWTDMLPYDASGVGQVARMLMRQDYYQLEWPLKTRRYEYGVYADGVLQHYAPFSMGVISGIANA